MYPCVEIVEHAGVDTAGEIENIFVPVKIAVGGLVLIPVDQIFCHPQFLAFLTQLLEAFLNTTILVSSINIEVGQYGGIIECVGV